LYCFFDSHDVGVEAVETNPPFRIDFFIVYVKHGKISGSVLNSRWELLPDIVGSVLI